MSWVNVWQRTEAISATNEIIGNDGSIEEYRRVLEIIQKHLGAESDGIRVMEESVKQTCVRAMTDAVLS